ncbi:MAG: A/G-specific adenine glycosylase [Verrucomicrobiae bacterium]|nr:A/G-specific adenine glycosylase [Verrucomicrobiae bacterium]
MNSPQTEPERADLQSSFSTPLRRWYAKNRRSLPWRETRDPYAILVSEIMLQQTQVQTVIPYYKRWMKQFPTPQALAGASEQVVLKAWEGLGYYRRARMLHQAARVIVSQHDGIFPRQADDVARLPGVGRYTLGAVASIALGQRLPVVDGNVSRVLCRYFAVEQPPGRPAVRKQLWEMAERLLPEEGVGDFNQAMMELGATVCLPHKPLCLFCPVRKTCRAYAQARQEDLPSVNARREVIRQYEYAALALSGGKVLLRQAGDGDRMARLWQFPSVLLGRPLRRWNEKWQDQFGAFRNARQIADISYTVTHHQIHLLFFKISGFRLNKAAEARWVNIADVAGLPFAAAHRKLADEYLNSR